MVDFVYVNDRTLPLTINLDSTFCKPSNHAKLTLSMALRSDAVSEMTDSNRYIRLFNFEKLMDVKHMDRMVCLARDPQDFTVESALDVILDFVDSFTEVIEILRRPQEKSSADTKRASREARKTERMLKRKTNKVSRRALLKLWSKQVVHWRQLCDRDNAAAVRIARSEFYSVVRNKNMHKAWKIVRRKLPGKRGGIS